MLNTFSGYQKSWLRPDVVAGMTTAAVVIPKAMAFATIAGMPVQVGLYTAFLPMIIYALFGTSRSLSVSTSTTIAILAGTQLSLVAPDGDPAILLRALAMLTLLVGAILILASVLRLGFVANFISEPVLVGFKAGIGLVIVVDQLPKLLGIHFDKGSFIFNLSEIVRHFPQISVATVAVGCATVATLVVMKRVAPRAPAPLIAVALGIASVSLLDLQSLGVRTIGQIPAGLPSVTLPDLSFAAVLWPGAVGIALMSFTETIAAGRAFLAGDEPAPAANRELLATGLANAGGALLGSIPSGGGTSQTAVNQRAGARTQLAELVTAAVTLVTMFFLAPIVGRMPQATLAGVVTYYSLGLIQADDFRAIAAIRRREFRWAVAALVGVVLLGTLQGIVVAITLSLIALAYQAANPQVYALGRKPGTNVFRPLSKEHPEDETFAGLLLIRLEGRAFFANAEYIDQKMRGLVAGSNPRVVALDMSGVLDLEYTALKMLTESERRYRDRGVALWLVGLNPDVLTTVQRSPLGKVLGRDRMFFNLERAVAHYSSLSTAS